MLLAAPAACDSGGPTYDPDAPEGKAYIYRQSVMELIDAKSRVVVGMAREEIRLDETAFVEAARDLASLSTMLIDGFENQTVIDESRTDPAVWDNWDDFQQKVDSFVETTAELAQVAERDGFAAAQGIVQRTSQACGNCHRPYRRSRPE